MPKRGLGFGRPTISHEPWQPKAKVSDSRPDFNLGEMDGRARGRDMATFNRRFKYTDNAQIEGRNHSRQLVMFDLNDSFMNSLLCYGEHVLASLRELLFSHSDTTTLF